jgi:hypothetical protein
MRLDAVEETFDDNNRVSVGRRLVEIEEHERFAESWWESILRVRVVDGSAGVGDQKSVLLVNRYDDTVGHETLSGVTGPARPRNLPP